MDFVRMLGIIALVGLGACNAQERSYALVTVDRLQTVGVRLRELPRDILHASGLPYGLLVVQLDDSARRAGLRIGDIVYGVNQAPIRDVEDFRRMTQAGDSAAGRFVGLLVRRGKVDLYVAVEVGMARSPEDLSSDGPQLPGIPARDTVLRI